MAKTKRARKRAKQKKLPVKQDPASRPEVAKHPRFFWVEFDPETKYRLVYFSPIFSGAFWAAGLVLDQFLEFSIILGVFIAAFYCGLSETGERQRVRLSNRFALLYMVQIALCFLFFSLTQDPLSTALLALCALCMLLHQSLHIKQPRQLLLLVFALPVEMGLLMLLGIRSQAGYLFWPALWLGLAAGCVLSAFQLLEHLEVLEDAGWDRSKLSTDRKGNEVLRPQGSARLYSSFLMFGVWIVLIIATLNYLPREFVALGLLMLRIPQLASGFLEQSVPLEVLKTKTLQLAVWTALATFVLCQIVNQSY